MDKNLEFPTLSENQEKLVQIKTNLKVFSKVLYDFFLDGFSAYLEGPPNKLNLVYSPEYPCEYVLRNILTQTSFDLGVIRKANYQRSIDTFSKRLDKLDALAIEALNKFTAIDFVRPYVYFNRDTNVRVIPYANALFIGVPMSAMEDNGDLPAISHEVGHHIYKNAKINGQTLDRYFRNHFENNTTIVPPADRWILNWLEEIFADLYNVITAGPIAALTIQEILKDNLTEDLKKDDGFHPPGFIRPYVPIKVMELALQDPTTDQDAVNRLTKHLEEFWNDARKVRGLSDVTKFKTHKGQKVIESKDGTITFEDPIEIEEGYALSQIAEVINEMYDKLKESFDFIFNFSLPANQVEGVWSHLSRVEDSELIDLDAIYESFDNYIDGLDGVETIKTFTSNKNQDHWYSNRENDWNPNARFYAQTKVLSKGDGGWIEYIQTIKWSKIFADTRPVSGPEG